MTTPAPPASLAVRGVTVVAVVVVAVIAAVVSYSHMHDVADQAGERWRSYLVPLSIDGLVVAASMVLLTRHRAGLPGGWLPWGALGAGVAASLAANMADANPTVIARLIAAWPAAAFAVAFELLLLQRRAERSASAPPPPTAPPTVSTVPQLTPPPVAPTRSWVPSTPAPTIARGEPEQTAAASIVAPPPPAAAAPAPPDGLAPRPDPARTAPPIPDPGSTVGPSRVRETGADSTTDDDLIERVRGLLDDTAPGTRPPGRREIAKRLNISEYRARLALDQIGATTGTALNGTSAAQHPGHRSRAQ